jgi:type IV pilus biogenesis protein CpaD/CtpE
MYVRDLVDRAVVFVCRYDRAAREALVITLWESEDGVGPARVSRRFTNALKDTDQAVSDKRREE